MVLQLMCLSFIVEGHLWQCISRKMAEQFQQAVREAATLCPRPMQVVTLWRSTGSGSLWVVAYINCWRQDKLSGDLNSQPKRPGDLDLWPFDFKSCARVTCDVGYLCANFSLPRPLCSRLRLDVRLPAPLVGVWRRLIKNYSPSMGCSARFSSCTSSEI